MKKSLAIMAAVLAVLLVAAIVLPMVLRGRIGEMIRCEASARLDGHLDFRKLDISLLRHFPYASLDLKGVILTGSGRFEGDTIVLADRVSVVVGATSLFGGGFEVAKVKLIRPAVYAHKLADGTVNWDVVKASEEGTAGESESFHFSLRDLRVAEASIRYVDDSTRMRFSALPVSLRLKGELSAPKAEIDLYIKAFGIRLVSGSMTLIGGANAEFDARLRADLVNKRFTFGRNTLRLNAIPLSLDGRVDLSNPDAVKMDVRADCSKVQFKDVLSMVPAFYTRDFNNLTASGDLTLSAWVKGELRGSLLPAFEIKLGVRDGQFQYTALPKAVTDIGVEARVASRGGTFDNVTLDVSDFSLVMAGDPVKISFSASHPLSDLRVDASVSGRLDVGMIPKIYPLRGNTNLGGLITADVHVAGRLSDIDSQRYGAIESSGAFVVEGMRARLAGLPDVKIRRAAASLSPESMTLGEFDVTVGRSELTANGQLTGYIGYLLDGLPLTGRLYVKSSFVDMNEIMAAIPSAEVFETADTASLGALIVPRNLHLWLSADVRKIELGHMTFTDFTGDVRTAWGTAALERLSMKAFGGSLLASGSYSTAFDARCPDLTLALDIAHASFVRTFEEMEMVQALVPLFRNTGGDYSMTLDLSAQLDSSMSPDLRTLSARGELRSANVRIQNTEVFAMLAEVLHDDKLRTIDAKDVRIRFSVAEGRMATQPFDLRTGPVTLNLSGTTGFDRSIDYVARISLPAAGVFSTMEIGIGGTFSEPKITLGVQEIAREAAVKLLGKTARKK